MRPGIDEIRDAMDLNPKHTPQPRERIVSADPVLGRIYEVSVYTRGVTIRLTCDPHGFSKHDADRLSNAVAETVKDVLRG